jgi:hypothetical protein
MSLAPEIGKPLVLGNRTAELLISQPSVASAASSRHRVQNNESCTPLLLEEIQGFGSSVDFGTWTV